MSLESMRNLALGYAAVDLVLILLVLGAYWLYCRVVLRRLIPAPTALHTPWWRQLGWGAVYALAAIALCTVQTLDKRTPDGSYGTPNAKTVEAVVDMKVQKHGRTSGRTYGEVYALNATVNVTYDRGTALRF